MTLIVEIFKDRTAAVTLVITQQLYGCTKLEQLYLLIQNLVLQYTHNLEAGVVRAGEKARLGTSAALFTCRLPSTWRSKSTPSSMSHLAMDGSLLDHDLQQFVVILHVTTLEVSESGDRGVFRSH